MFSPIFFSICLGQASEKIVLFDSSGNFQGTTEQFYRFFFGANEKVTQNHLMMFNLYNFIPDLDAIIEKNHMFKDKSVISIINQSSAVFIPEDFTEILDVLNVKIKEENESKSHKSLYSAKSDATKKSSNSQNNGSTKNSRFITKFFKTKTMQKKSLTDKQTFEKKLQNSQNPLTNYDVLKELVDTTHATKYYINFNIVCHHYKTSKTEDLSLGVLYINKITQRKQKAKKDDENENKGDIISLDNSKIESNKDYPPPSSYKESEGYKSGFIHIPHENEVHFNGKNENEVHFNEKNDNEVHLNERNKSDVRFTEKTIPEILNTNILPTENDHEDLMLMNQHQQPYTKRQTLSPPKPIENKLSFVKNLLVLSSGFQTVSSNQNLSLNDQRLEEIEKKKNSASESENAVKTLSSAHKVRINEVTSHHSSINSIKKTFSIFSVIKMIQKYVPPSLRNFTFCQFLELLIIISYCLLVFLLNVQYIDKYYNPLQNSISSLAKIYNSYAVSSLVTVRYELEKYGYASKTTGENADLYNTIFNLIFTESFKEMKELVESERSKKSEFDYQYLLKTISLNSTSLNAPIVLREYFLDFLNQITEILMKIVSMDFVDLQVSLLEYLPVNYKQFLSTYLEIIAKINSQFYSSNHDIIDTIKSIMIFLMLFTFTLKIFQTCFMLNFTSKIIKVINIFLRVHQNEAFNELMFSKEILQSLTDPQESYLNIQCTEKLLNRKVLKLNEEDVNRNSNITRNTQGKKKKSNKVIAKKNVKKFSFHNMKALSNWPLFYYITFTFLLLFAYIFFNYYYASILTDKIDQLIGISMFFENLYTLPTTTVMLNRILVREKIITNAMYSYPQPEEREKQLYLDLQIYIADLYKTSKEIPTYSINTEILKSQTLHLLIYGDICECLLVNQLIESNQNNLCEATLNGAFTKGILNVITELINTLNADDSICKPISFSDQIARDAQKQGIFDVFKTNAAIDRIMTEYYLNKALMLFNEKIQEYYGNIMLTEMQNLKVVVLTTGIILLFFFAGMLYLAHQYLQRIYGNMTLVLNLIPYDKLNNDEQTLFLIKKFWRG